MMHVTISRRDRRTLILGACVIGSLVVLTRGIPIWRTWVQETNAVADEQLRLVVRTEGLLAQARVSNDSLAARNARYLALAPSLVGGATPAEASATLASLVSAAASAAGVKLGAVQLRPITDTAAHHTFVRVGVNADLVGDITGITTLLATLERGPTRLRIRDFTVTQQDAAAPADRVEALRADLTVEGLAFPHEKGGRTP